MRNTGNVILLDKLSIWVYLFLKDFLRFERGKRINFVRRPCKISLKFNFSLRCGYTKVKRLARVCIGNTCLQIE